ncbi:30S ribosomal protein S17 [Candidatus Peregrinibacteria bacterium]|nr:30S ribosomal protein S17 [Candidatus Peregrinibacteria bacterium]
MRTKEGIVVSDKMNKTIVVKVESAKEHPKYKKRFKTSKKYYADNPENKYKVGDKVIIYETRPLSKLKRWTTNPPNKTLST